MPCLYGILGLSKVQDHRTGRHFLDAGYNASSQAERDRGRVGVVSHAGARLLADLSDASTLTGHVSAALVVLADQPVLFGAGGVGLDGEPVDSAQVGELTGLLPSGALSDYPPGMRVIVRREQPTRVRSWTCSNNATAVHRSGQALRDCPYRVCRSGSPWRWTGC